MSSAETNKRVYITHKRGSLTFLDRATQAVEGSQLGALLWVKRVSAESNTGMKQRTIQYHTHCVMRVSYFVFTTFSIALNAISLQAC
jgi:hypothetical protein